MVEYRKDTNVNNISFSFEVTDGEGSGVAPQNVSCTLRDQSQAEAEQLAECTSPVEYSRPEGRYVFNVRAVDRARLNNEPTVRLAPQACGTALNDAVVVVDMY